MQNYGLSILRFGIYFCCIRCIGYNLENEREKSYLGPKFYFWYIDWNIFAFSCNGAMRSIPIFPGSDALQQCYGGKVIFFL